MSHSEESPAIEKEEPIEEESIDYGVIHSRSKNIMEFNRMIVERFATCVRINHPAAQTDQVILSFVEKKGSMKHIPNESAECLCSRTFEHHLDTMDETLEELTNLNNYHKKTLKVLGMVVHEWKPKEPRNFDVSHTLDLPGEELSGLRKMMHVEEALMNNNKELVKGYIDSMKIIHGFGPMESLKITVSQKWGNMPHYSTESEHSLLLRTMNHHAEVLQYIINTVDDMKEKKMRTWSIAGVPIYVSDKPKSMTKSQPAIVVVNDLDELDDY